MLISLKWLSEYVPLTLPAKELAERLSIAGVKVERIISRGDGWDGIRVAQVLDVQPHPNPRFTRIRVVTVDMGDDKQTVICGAPNVAVGLKVAFATEGTRLRDGHTGEMTTLKAVDFHGVQSAGMVLSEKELGLSDDHSGIVELPEDAPVGEALSDYYGDTIFELEVTPNRPDHMSMLGVAWEVAAQTHTKVREPERVYNEAAYTGRQPAHLRRDRGQGPVSALHRRHRRARQGGAFAGVDAGASHGGRDAPDQQHSRHNELRHAGDGPAFARLRLPQARWQPHRGAPREAG